MLASKDIDDTAMIVWLFYTHMASAAVIPCNPKNLPILVLTTCPWGNNILSNLTLLWGNFLTEKQSGFVQSQRKLQPHRTPRTPTLQNKDFIVTSMAVPQPRAIHLLQLLMIGSPKGKVLQEYEQHLDFNSVIIYDCEEQNRISSPPQLLILQKLEVYWSLNALKFFCEIKTKLSCEGI